MLIFQRKAEPFRRNHFRSSRIKSTHSRATIGVRRDRSCTLSGHKSRASELNNSKSFTPYILFEPPQENKTIKERKTERIANFKNSISERKRRRERSNRILKNERRSNNKLIVSEILDIKCIRNIQISNFILSDT